MYKAFSILVPLIAFVFPISIGGCGSGGGDSGSPNQNTLKFRWSLPEVFGTPPEKIQEEHAGVFDPSKGRILLSWGTNSGSIVPELWEIRLLEEGKVAWTKLLPSSAKETPDPRAGHSAVYDPSVQRLIVFGGILSGTVLSQETWAVDFSNDKVNGEWQSLVADGSLPVQRTGHSAVFDETNKRMLVFGGWNQASSYYSDLWELNLGIEGAEAWTKSDPGEGPGPRADHTAILDPTNSRMIVYGGTDGLGPLNDVWELAWDSGNFTWNELEIGGSFPASRSGHTAVFDPTSERMVVFGGFNGVNRLNDVWVLDLSEPGTGWWIKGIPQGAEIPEARNQHIAVRDENAKTFRMFVFGGHGDSSGRVWEFEWLP